ncbi:MAG TPA: alpha/beta hydrolase [Acidimicrobiales bacterium]|nr:alpha/beta hydrolase [Acidimicrobiales bacterium]
MAEVTHRFVDTNGIRMHVAEAGPEHGPIVVLCHGFPESWYSWRHQLHALGDAGYHVVAPDQRGYGQTEAPEPIEAYTQLHLVGDIIGLLDALDAPSAVIAGHDWGAPVAWNTALWRPDRVRAVIGLSVPFTPRAPMRPTQLLDMLAGKSFMYILYFQEPGVAEANLGADVRKSIRGFMYVASGDIDPSEITWGQRGRDATMTDHFVDPKALPSWLTDADVDFYTGEFERVGFRGGLNWYRNIDRTWELTAAWAGAVVTPPALFIAGTRDGVIAMNPGAVEQLPTVVPNLRRTVMLEGCGHWTQQERPDEVNAAMLEFLASLT